MTLQHPLGTISLNVYGSLTLTQLAEAFLKAVEKDEKKTLEVLEGLLDG